MKNLQYASPDIYIRGGIKQNAMKQHTLNIVSKANSLRIPNWKSILFKALKKKFLDDIIVTTENTYYTNREANIETHWR